jgi:hypothetical protein
MAGYPDGSFGPKRPITRAESVATLNRSLLTPIGTPTPTPTPGGETGPGSGGSEPTGTYAYLTGIEVDGAAIADFHRDTLSYRYETNNAAVKVEGKALSSAYKVEYSVNSGSYTTAIPTAVSVEGSVRIRVSRSGYKERVYTVTLAKPGSVDPGPGTETGWDELSEITVTTLRQDPSLNFYKVKFDMTVAAAHAGKYEYIKVNGEPASKYSLDPEKWSAELTFDVDVNQSNYKDHINITFEPYSDGSEWTTIQGAWNAPVTEVKYRITRQDPSLNFYRKEFVVTTDPALGTFTEITVKGIPAETSGSNTWTVTITEAAAATTLSPSEVVAPDFVHGSDPTDPGGSDNGELFLGTPAFYYSSSITGYLFYVDVVNSEVSNIDAIEVTDALGTVIASTTDGSITKSTSNYNRFNGMLLGEQRGDRNGEVTFTLTTKSGDSKPKTVTVEN